MQELLSRAGTTSLDLTLSGIPFKSLEPLFKLYDMQRDLLADSVISAGFGEGIKTWVVQDMLKKG